MRLLKERAQYKPLKGTRRVFLIDQADRAGEQAANSLLKILEEPPDHLILIMTAENVYDLLPTIRSRSVILNFSPLTNEEMQEFARVRKLDNAERRIALSGGSPGVAASLDIDLYQKRRASMLALIEDRRRGVIVCVLAAGFGNAGAQQEREAGITFEAALRSAAGRDGAAGRRDGASATTIFGTICMRWLKRFRGAGLSKR